ncbi:MAG: hypothetical protein ACE5F1_08080 [Planctomycetota bacterium]
MPRLLTPALAVCPVLALGGVLRAQSISPTFVSATEMKCEVNVHFFWKAKRTVGANTDLTNGLRLLASTMGATASTSVTFQRARTVIVATIRDSGNKGSSPHSLARTGPHDTLLTFQSPKPIKAKLVLTSSSNGGGGNGTFWTYSSSVAINGRTGFVGQKGTRATKEFPVTIDSKGLKLRTSTSGSAGDFDTTRNAYFSGTLRIELRPGFACSLIPYGRTCSPAGPVLLGAPTLSNELELGLTMAPPNAFGKLIVGLKPLDIRIPGTTCYLSTDIRLLLPFTTNGRGEATHTLPVPPGLKLTFNLQDVLFQKHANSFVITSTNGLRVDCK